MMTKAQIKELRKTYKDPSEPLPHGEFHELLDLVEHLQGKVGTARRQLKVALFYAEATPKHLVAEVLETLSKPLKRKPAPKEPVNRAAVAMHKAEAKKNAADRAAIADVLKA